MKRSLSLSVGACAIAVCSLAASAYGLKQQRVGRQEARLSAQRVQSQTVGLSAPLQSPRTKNAPEKRHCVMGVDTFAVTTARTQAIPQAAGAARVTSLRQVSSRAVFAERFVELAKPAPTLPKRMGSTRNPADTSARIPEAPTPIECGGYADFPVSAKLHAPSL